MEYRALTWMSEAATYTQCLQAGWRRSLQMLGEEPEIPANMTSLKHRRDLSAIAHARPVVSKTLAPGLATARPPMRDSIHLIFGRVKAKS